MTYEELVKQIGEDEEKLAILHSRHANYVYCYLANLSDELAKVGLTTAWEDTEPDDVRTRLYVIRVYDSSVIFEHITDLNCAHSFKQLQESVDMRLMPYYEKKKAYCDLQKSLANKEPSKKAKV